MFHPISLIIPLLVLAPNIIYFAIKPGEAPDRNSKNENPILLTLEIIGRIGVFILPLFSAIQVEGLYEIIAIIGMMISIVFYYCGWIRYWIRDGEFRLLFTPVMGIPVPMAISPVVYFLFASVILHSISLFVSSIILAIGHVPISLNTLYRISKDTQREKTSRNNFSNW